METKIKKIKKLQQQVVELETEILKLAGGDIIRIEQYFSVVGSWNCKKSPCGLCCYNHYADPVHDHCVFCGEPEERK